MPYFPQLSSGATGQYPVQKRRTERTIINQLPDGHTVKFADAGAEQVEWQLTFQDLTDSEIAGLQQFFATCEGQLNGFTFLDPLDNLLVWSEALNEPAWEASTLLQFTAGISDPNGGTGATTIVNPTGSDVSVQQSVDARGRWCIVSVPMSGVRTEFRFRYSVRPPTHRQAIYTQRRRRGAGSASVEA